ncbi:Lutropin-choriogonadotropic hormone receptor, partial [Armadillidium nasatum]
MPCKDLFDWWTLRCGIWIVFLLALLGNGVVVVVLIFARAKMDVPRFLVTNLALADFFMGIYLGFLAIVDASTLGEFRMYAIPWQMSTGCRIAGFFGVLSSELSVYTLTVITLERNYAITHAMHLNKRLSLRHAAYIMSAGWVFSIIMAVLPIMGISDYRKFAVCLPFETAGGGLAYVIFLMFINGIAFLILMGCYLKIYCAIRGSQAWNSNDSRIAKRMALLVFTDFLCWAPIAFLSLTAASGVQLISLEEAKIFTIFILPLNSCCNPFLYALLTKQFKKDCVMLCKTIEESRVTRGIGRCRHSSNFSNRQTPANTNSAIDPISKGADNQICVCHSKQKKHSKLRNRLRLAAIKYFLCNKSLEETNGSNEYTYQQTKATIKSTRNASLS